MIIKESLIRVGLIGAGTVGQEVIGNLQKYGGSQGLELRKAAVGDLSKKRKYDAAYTTDVKEVLNDPKINIVVELMGGIELATDYMLDAIDSGKSLVTANKAALAKSTKTVFDAARVRGVDVGFEASVAGKIPVIATLRHFKGERVDNIVGILNGTSNFILTRMLEDNMPYDEALKLAQEKGFAEKDPSLDVGGDDAADKIVLLASIAHNTPFDRDKISPVGIDIITLEAMKEAEDKGLSIKPLASAVRGEDGKVQISVGPKEIKADDPLFHVMYENNGVKIDTENGNPVVLQGPGAGGEATASAVLSDIRRIAENLRKGTTDDLPTLDGNVFMRV